MKKILLLNLLLAMLLGATSAWAAVGDVFTANVTVIEDGETKQVPMRFQIQEPVQLYFGGYNNQTLPSCITYAQIDAISGVTTPAINKYQHGIVKIPTVVEGPDNLWYYVTGIGEDSFYGCNFSEIELPERYYKFEYASGRDTAYKIGIYAFHLSKITSIFIPDHYYIDGAIIRYCEQLTSVSIGEDDLYNSTLPDNFFMGCTSLKSVEFRGPVRTIRGNPFANCYALESISFPEGLETIESNAFHTCMGLKTVFLPSTLTQISSNAFSDCKKLENVILKCETPPTVNMLSGNNPFANISSSAVLYVPDRTKYLQEPWTSWFSEIKSILPTVEQTVNTWFYYSVGLTWDLFDYNHGYTESVTASDILDLMIDGVPTVPEVWEGYNQLIVSKDPKHIPQEVSFLRKTSKGLVPYKLHYNVHNFGFSINGKEMTSLDMYNIPGLVSGDAYIAVPINAPDYPTLVLDNATLEWDTNAYGLSNHDLYQDGLTIKVIGDCTIRVPNAYAAFELDVATATYITGGGTLHILSNLTCIETWVATTLRIQDNTTVIAESTNGRGFYDGDGVHLTVKDGGVFAAYSRYEPIDLDTNAEVTFGEGIGIRYPEGAYFGEYNYVYYADGTKVQGDWVVIGPDTWATHDAIATGIAKSFPSGEDLGEAYNLAGQKVGEDYRGIVIKDGKKTLKK